MKERSGIRKLIWMFFVDCVGLVLNFYKVMVIVKIVKECLVYFLGLFYGSKSWNVNSESWNVNNYWKI